MTKTLLAAAGLLLITCTASAQTTTTTNTNNGKKEIIIEERSNGKNERTVIVVDGEKVTINGKPSSEYKGKKHLVIDDDIIINGDHVMVPGRARIRATAPGRAYSVASTNQAVLGVLTEASDGKGAKITEVVEESGAAKAGLKVGDIITAVNDVKVAEEGDLSKAIRMHKPEQNVDIAYTRNGDKKKVKATLGKSKATSVYTPSMNYDAFNFNLDMDARAMANGSGMFNGQVFSYFNKPRFGMTVEDYADGDGVKITQVDSASNAEKAGLKTDDIITAVNGKSIKTLEALRKEMNTNKEEASTIELTVNRAGRTETKTLRIPKRIQSANL